MTQHEYERGYRNPLTGEEPRDPHRYLKAAILCLVLGLALLYPIFCSGQEVPPGALLSETVLRISAGSSGTGTQPPFAPTTRPASSTIDRNGRGGVDGRLGNRHGDSSTVCGVNTLPPEQGCVQPRSTNSPLVKRVAGSEPARVHSFIPLALTYAGLQAVDLLQTTSALNSGRYREANGALSGIAGSPWKLALAKGAVTSGSLLGIYAMRTSHPRASKWLLVGLAGAQGGIVIWNARQMR